MICPTCHNPMIVVEHEQIELDFCPDCSGTWFDAGELELLLDRVGVEDSGSLLSDLLASPEAETDEKKRKCPICNKKMKKTTIGKEPVVVIDECVQGDGLWFDGGEVGHLIGQGMIKPEARTESQERVITFLEETFTTGGEPKSNEAD